MLECLSKFIDLLPLPLPTTLTSFISQTITKFSDSKPEFIVGHIMVLISIIRATGELPLATLRPTLESILRDKSSKPQYRAASLACAFWWVVFSPIYIIFIGLAAFVELKDDAIINDYILRSDCSSFALLTTNVSTSSTREGLLLTDIIRATLLAQKSKLGIKSALMPLLLVRPLIKCSDWIPTAEYRPLFDALVHLMARSERSIVLSAFAAVKGLFFAFFEAF